ncbi:Magnesium-chelatase 60 kDa subunit (fragment) [Beijerinckiaceae bacterium RH AL1]
MPSLRVAGLALRAAKAAAALAGRDAVAADDLALAAALVITPRATQVPAPPEAQEPEQAEESPAETPPEQPSDAEPGTGDQDLSDLVVEATRAAIPADLLAALGAAAAAGGRQSAPGRAGVTHASLKRGRPAGVRRGAPGHGVRLAVVETLRAAAPWQRLRRATAPATPNRILVRREDFRVARFKEKSETLTLFVVDASGSSALHRLAEVKGAVELILAECYVRRDQVALIAFRGNGAELILPPTRSLVRAKRALAGQAGGGGTPLAAGLELAAHVADAGRRRGQAPVVVVMTDGKANVGRGGRPGRAEAEAEAMAAARALRLVGGATLVLDTAPRPGDAAARLASAMGARYIPLPYADAQGVSRAVMAATPSAATLRAGNI